jgi:D-alanyl-D-alanine carboxypeptidase/D-alanyl-D-alanine-endopeptidase (penicillin-binding protein 4)
MVQSISTTRLRGLLTLCAVLLLMAPIEASASTNRDVKRAMNRLSGASGAYAFDITSGRALAGRRQGSTRIVASNAKLFTAAAALLRFGTGGRFSTGVWTTGTVSGGVLDGDLYLRGGGGPLFGSDAYVKRYFGSRATLEALAANLHSKGITEVTGTIYGDQTAFDTRRGTAYSGWRRSSDIGGTLGGLIVDKGFAGGRWQTNPPKFAAARLAIALKGAGVKVGTRTGSRATPAAARRLAYVRSLPISALVRQMNKPSNNYLAEMLVKSLALPPSSAEDDADGGLVPIGARRASTEAGTRRAMITAGSLRSRVSLIDGSGLSRGDRAAPREVVDLLRAMVPKVAFADFRASLPIAGVDGTLARRMRGTAAHRKCQAKTGTLSNVSTLSGYCTTAGGHLVAFSVLQNRVAPWAAHAQQDRVAATIAALR